MLHLLHKIIQKPDDSAYPMAVELSKELRTTFAYIIDVNHKDFCPHFLVATFLTPEYKRMIKPEHKPAIWKILEGNKFILCKVHCKLNFSC